MPQLQFGGNSVTVHMSHGNMKPLHCIKSCAKVDGWSVSQTFSTAQESFHHILNTLMLKLNFNMPKVKKSRKTQNRNRSPSPEVSERSTESAQATTEVEIHASKEPEDPVDEAEAEEPTVTLEGSIGDTPITPTQPDPSKKHIKSTSVIYSDEDEAHVVEWLTDHPLMYNNKIKEYKETDKKEKVWEELAEELGFTGRHKLNFYLLLLVLSQ